MKTATKYTVGIFFGLLVLLGGLYSVSILGDRITVSLPSSVCKDATLRVTKDDFTLKCGRYIAFQADTITEYYKTYGKDEWVRNNRFVGLNKKHITLELIDYGNYFDITRKTRYRKGRQNIDDGVLYETYTFTKDKIKITYNYEVNNKALHRISMRIKKQVNSHLDAFDFNGHTGVQRGNVLSYEGYGNMIIDPTVTLGPTPADFSILYAEGDIVPFICMANSSTNFSQGGFANVSLWWNAENESDFHLNESVAITVNTTVTFSKRIPHPVTGQSFPGIFNWTCQACNGTGVAANCTFGTNRTLDPKYFPEPITITAPDDRDLNLLNGTGWGMELHWAKYMNLSTDDTSILFNWSWTGIPDNNTGIVWNLSYFGTLNSTRKYDPIIMETINTTLTAYLNTSALVPDSYFITLRACNALNTSLCVNTTITNPIDIFDYTLNISTRVSTLRFSPQPTYIKGAALGQTATVGILEVGWVGSSFPTGKINLSLNYTGLNQCGILYALDSDNSADAAQLIGNKSITALNTTSSDPDYVWLWLTKNTCSTTTISFNLFSDIYFSGRS